VFSFRHGVFGLVARNGMNLETHFHFLTRVFFLVQPCDQSIMSNALTKN